MIAMMIPQATTGIRCSMAPSQQVLDDSWLPGEARAGVEISLQRQRQTL
jgi:hypothetical protein